MVDVCKNGVICLDFVGGYNCICLLGFKGEYCDIGQLQLVYRVNLQIYYILQKKKYVKDKFSIVIYKEMIIMFKKVMICLNLFKD